MDISYAYVKAIFDTLPIGYYLGRRIDVMLNESGDQAYFSPFEDKIIITISATAPINPKTKLFIFHLTENFCQRKILYTEKYYEKRSFKKFAIADPKKSSNYNFE